MSFELKVPGVGESVTEVEIGGWKIKEGDQVKVDQDLVELLTDKVNQVLPSPVAGVVTKIIIKAGAPAKVGEVIALIEVGASAGATPVAAPAAAAVPAAPKADAQKVMPAAARVLAENNLKPSDFKGSGPGGRLLKEDVVGKSGIHAAISSAPAAVAAAPAAAKTCAPAAACGERGEEVVRMTPLRRAIARNLLAAQQNAALLTTFNEVDMTAVMELRTANQDRFVARHGIKLGFMSFFVKATVEALKQFPSVNAEVRGEDIVYKKYHDIGIAIGGGKGLVVPILRNAERFGLAEIEKGIADYAGKAKAGTLKAEDLQGGTFTITNGGVYGSLLSTPIVNAPQSGVLGMHGIVRRPIAVGTPGKDERIEIRPMMYIALTYDHRIVDGREAVTFLKTVKELVEDPARIVLAC